MNTVQRGKLAKHYLKRVHQTQRALKTATGEQEQRLLNNLYTFINKVRYWGHNMTSCGEAIQKPK